MGRTPDNVAKFNAAMADLTRVVTPAILRCYDFSGLSHLMDVGGGSGELLGAIARQNPNLRGTVFDLPRCAAAVRACGTLAAGRYPRRSDASRKRATQSGARTSRTATARGWQADRRREARRRVEPRNRRRRGKSRARPRERRKSSREASARAEANSMISNEVLWLLQLELESRSRHVSGALN